MHHSGRQFHPAVLVTAGLLCALGVQLIGSPVAFVVSAALTVCAFLASGVAFRRMVWRLKWIFLSVFVLFTWQTPGRALIPQLLGWSPVIEGLELALTESAQLVALLAVVCLLMSRLQPVEWVAALHALAWPLSPLGSLRERLAVRLMLVLDELQGGRAEAASRWRDYLLPAQIESRSERWILPALRSADRLAIALLLAAACGVTLWRASF